MASLKTYLVNAVYQWSVDLGFTPHIIVDCTHKGVTVPDAYVANGQITLNVSPGAVQNFSLQDDWVTFTARFSGQPLQIQVPVRAILAIFARETGKGINFAGGAWEDEDPNDDGPGPGAPHEDESRPAAGNGDRGGRKGPRLKVIK